MIAIAMIAAAALLVCCMGY